MMDALMLKEFFEGKRTIDDIMPSLKEETSEYAKALLITGSSAPIYETNGNFVHIVSKGDVRKLISFGLTGEISELSVSYLANLLELSEAFRIEDEVVEDALFELSSPDVNGPLSRGVLERIDRMLTV